jgi:hypothetical protein
LSTAARTIRSAAIVVLFWPAAAIHAQPDPQPDLIPDVALADEQAEGQPEGSDAGPVGRVAFLVEPPDARIAVGHRILRAVNATVEEAETGLAAGRSLLRPGAPHQVAPEGSVREQQPATDEALGIATLPAGHHLAEVSRPGYLPTLAGFTVTEGEDMEVTVALKRASAAVRLRTAPSGATILIDGFVRGRTEGRAEPGFDPAEAALSTFRGSFSRSLWIGDLAAGSYRLEARKDGYRSYRASLDVAGARDYELPPVVLEAQQAFLLLKDLPDDARVYANGRELRPDREKLMPEAPVPPGRVDLVATRGVHAYFEASVVVEDGAWLEVPVELRPALAWLGVFGEDAAGLRAVSTVLDVLRQEGAYIVLDRELEGAAVFDDLAIRASTLRDRTAAQMNLDWKAVQARVEDQAPAALYLLAVLSDDLVADTVDLWWWSAAPGPSRPDVLTIEIPNGRIGSGTRRRLARSLNPRLEAGQRAPRLGAVLIESLKGGALVVATVDAGGPAAGAGLRPGMEVIEINGEAASSTLQVNEALSSLRPGGTIELAIAGAEGTVALAVEPEWGWTGLDVFTPDLMSSVAAAHLIREIERPGDAPRWLLELDLAALLLAAGDASGAVRLLQTIDAPDRDGLGMGTVQYGLGMAMSDLAAAGQEEYRQRARQIFRALGATAQGRIGADGGPSAPARARLRLEAEANE